MTVRSVTTVLIAGAALCLFGARAFAQLSPPRYRDDRVIVKPRRDLPVATRAETLRSAHVALGAQLHREYSRFGGLQVLRLPRGVTVVQAIARLNATGLFEYVQPDYVRQLCVAPNDTLYAQGQMYGMNKISGPAAWDVRTNADPVVVAVIDTGIRYTHEDLASNMWVNVGEVPGNGLDDDNNGYIDDVYGIDAATNNVLAAGNPWDTHGHGTHCAGTVGAAGNNGKGVVGVCWKVRLMALKFINPAGGSDSDAIECINYALANGAQILSNSWGDQGDSPALRDAIAACRAVGVIFVAAAGNLEGNIDAVPFLPAGFDLDNIVAVTATDVNDAQFYNYGRDTVDLGAPGRSIYSTYNTSDSTYVTSDGTSMACPHVAGALALVKAQYSSETYTQLIHRVLGNVDPLASLSNKCVTGGRLNLYKALTQPPIPVPRFRADAVGGLTMKFTDLSIGDITNRVWDFADSSAPDSLPVTYHTYATAGVRAVTLNAWSAAGSNATTRTSNVVSNYYLQPTPYAWVDPASLTLLAMGNETSASLSLPFTFTYYGLPYTALYVSANGLLTFNTAAGLTYAGKLDLPNTAIPNNIVAPYWTDLNPGVGGDVRYGTTGLAPYRKFILSWNNVPHADDTNVTFSFQILLSETSNDLVLQYRDVAPTNSAFGAGRCAAIGLENADGSAARRVAFSGTPPLANNKALLFSMNPPPLPLQNVSLAGPSLVFAVDSLAGQVYQLQRRDALDTGTWADSGPPVTGDNSVLNIADPGAASLTQQFYRVKIVP